MIARGLAPVSKKLFAFRHPPRSTAKGLVLTERLQTIFYFLKNMLPFQNV